MIQYQTKLAISDIISACRVLTPRLPDEPPVERQIIDFLDGRTHGEDLLHALYDHILDEPIPQRIRSLLQC
jgi:hypothetical protein